VREGAGLLGPALLQAARSAVLKGRRRASVAPEALRGGRLTVVSGRATVHVFDSGQLVFGCGAPGPLSALDGGASSVEEASLSSR